MFENKVKWRPLGKVLSLEVGRFSLTQDKSCDLSNTPFYSFYNVFLGADASLLYFPLHLGKCKPVLPAFFSSS